MRFTYLIALFPLVVFIIVGSCGTPQLVPLGVSPGAGWIRFVFKDEWENTGRKV